jgi:DNA repair exonuclease SbcCD ATPase subunit
MSLEGVDDREKLTNLCKKTYKEQAVWFLNATWEGQGQAESETVWKYVHKCADLDVQKKATGFELDELNAHRFLEHFKNERTVKALRDELRAVGVDNFKYIPLTMFLIWNNKFDWHTLVNAPQGDNSEAIAKASRMLEESQAACNEAIRLANEAAASEKAAKARAEELTKREAEAKVRIIEAQKAAEELKKAEEEVAAALGELKAQEDAFNNKTEDLKKKSEEGSTVQKSKAANELAQHLASDPLPLRKAKTTTEAAKRKAEKARIAGELAIEKSKQAAAEAAEARKAAEKAAAQAEVDRQAAEDSVEVARGKVAEAEAFLEEQKHTASKAGAGAIWWLERELQEQKKYMPQSKGGVVRK